MYKEIFLLSSHFASLFFSAMYPISSLTLSCLLMQCLDSGLWSELGSTKDKTTALFSRFLIPFPIFPGFRDCTTRNPCAFETRHQLVWYKRGTLIMLILRWPHRIGTACEHSPISRRPVAIAFWTPRLFPRRQLTWSRRLLGRSYFFSWLLVFESCLLQIIRDGVTVVNFFHHLKGNLKG